MTYTVKIKGSNHTLFVEQHQSVLDAAIEQGYDFPYSCRSATCATCMGKILSGSVNYGDYEPYALSIDEQQDGFALFCLAKPNGDLSIEIDDVYPPEYTPVRTLDYKIDEHQHLAHDVHKILLSPVGDKALRYTPGQYLKIITDDNIPVPFSIANSPDSNSQQIELHIHDANDFQYTKAIVEKVTQRQNLTLRGPFGSMIHREKPELPIIFVAGGTGFVPLKAIIENLLASGFQRDCHLYWGGESNAHLYQQSLCQQWQEQHSNFHFKPILAQDIAHVHQAVLNDFADLSDYQCFASGSPEMVYATKKAFIDQGLHPHFIFSDVFECFPEDTTE